MPILVANQRPDAICSTLNLSSRRLITKVTEEVEEDKEVKEEIEEEPEEISTAALE